MFVNISSNKQGISNLNFNKKNNTFKQKNANKNLSKIKCNSDEISSVLSEMPEAFVSDKKRPSFSSLPVLQRIGRLNLLQEKDKISYTRQTFCNEINYEFRFLSLKQSIVKPKNSISIKLGIKKEDDLLFIQEKNKNNSSNAGFSSSVSGKIPQNKEIKLLISQLTLSTIFYKKFNYINKLLFAFTLILLSYLSII